MLLVAALVPYTLLWFLKKAKIQENLALFSAFVSSGDFLTYLLSNYCGELFSMLVWSASSTTLFWKLVCSYVSKATNTSSQESAHSPWDIQCIWNICVTPFPSSSSQFPQSQEKHVTEVLIFFFTNTTAHGLHFSIYFIVVKAWLVIWLYQREQRENYLACICCEMSVVELM